MAAGLDALRRRFCDDQHSEGYVKIGPVKYAAFHAIGDEDALIRSQRDASGLVQTLLDQIDAKFKDQSA